MEIEDLLNAFAKEIEKREKDNIGLFTGMSGFALYELTYGIYFQHDRYISVGLSFLDKVLQKVNKEKVIDSLCSGIAGVGWLLNYIKEECWDICDNIDPILNEIDDYLILRLNKYLSINYWDYLHGYIGIGEYFLTRVNHNPKILNSLYQMLDKLTKSAIENQYIVKWESINNDINISLSHGISSILIFLSHLYNQGIFTDKTYTLIENCAHYLLSQKVNFNKYNSFFPTFSLERGRNFYGSRYGWCYGDIGVCFALWYDI